MSTAPGRADLNGPQIPTLYRSDDALTWGTVAWPVGTYNIIDANAGSLYVVGTGPARLVGDNPPRDLTEALISRSTDQGTSWSTIALPSDHDHLLDEPAVRTVSATLDVASGPLGVVVGLRRSVFLDPAELVPSVDFSQGWDQLPEGLVTLRRLGRLGSPRLHGYGRCRIGGRAELLRSVDCGDRPPVG